MRKAFWGMILIGLALPVPVFAQDSRPDPFFGMHLHRADSGTAWPKAQFGSWRLWDAYVAWPNLEPRRGQWDFTRLDRFVAFGERFGIDILLPLGLSPTWASARPQEKSGYQPGNAAEPADMENWRRYVRTVAERYKGRIRHYEIWNEVNEVGFFSGSPEKMVELTCEARRVLREISPDNKVVSPSMVGAGSEPEKFEEFLKLGGKACIDVVGYHFYVPHREPEEILGLVRRVQQAMARQGVAQLSLWNTEFGWWLANSDGSPETEADKRWRRVTTEEGPGVVSRSLIVGRFAGLDRFYWYSWDHGYLGMLEPSTGAPKPAAVAYATVIRWMRNSIPQCEVQGARWICRLPEAEGFIRRVAWKVGASNAKFIPHKGERLVGYEKLDGSIVDTGASAQGLDLSGEPILVRTVTVR